MKIALTHNQQQSVAEEEAEFYLPSTVAALTAALASGGHEVLPVEVSGPVDRLVERLNFFQPELIFNVAEGHRGRAREAFYPALFAELRFPHTGSEAHVLLVGLDKWLTKLALAHHGVPTPRARFATARGGQADALEGMTCPAIVKPNFEGSSKGITDDSVCQDARALRATVDRILATYPEGVLIEEFIPGVDITVPYIEGLGDEGVLSPARYEVRPSDRSRYNLYDYRLKNVLYEGSVDLECPADLPPELLSRLKVLTKIVIRALGVRDLGRVDFRLGDNGQLYFLEVNALPFLDPTTAMAMASRAEGLDYHAMILRIVASACQRLGIDRRS